MGYINHLTYHYTEQNPGVNIPRVSDIFTCENDDDDDISWLVTLLIFTCIFCTHRFKNNLSNAKATDPPSPRHVFWAFKREG